MDERTDAAARRVFWTEKLDDAYAFMQRVRQQPVKECGEPLVPLKGFPGVVWQRSKKKRRVAGDDPFELSQDA